MGLVVYLSDTQCPAHLVRNRATRRFRHVLAWPETETETETGREAETLVAGATTMAAISMALFSVAVASMLPRKNSLPVRGGVQLEMRPSQRLQVCARPKIYRYMYIYVSECTYIYICVYLLDTWPECASDGNA